MKKRINVWGVWTLCAALILLLAACGTNNNGSGASNSDASPKSSESSTSPPSGQGEQITLKFLYIWPEYEELMNETIKNFEAANPNIKVEPEIVPWDKVIEVMQTKVASKQEPDVSFGWTHWMAPFVNEVDAALPLDEYLDKDEAWKNSFVRNDLLASSIVSPEKPYISNIPFKLSFQVVIYNKKMFQDNQLQIPQTREQLEAVMSTLASKGIIPLAASGKDGSLDILKDSFAGMNFFRNGTATGDWLKGEESYEAPEHIEAMELTKRWYEQGFFGKDAFAVGGDEVSNLLLSKKAAMTLGNNNQISALQPNIDDELGAFLFPAPEGMKAEAPLTADGFFVLKTTKHPEESVAFLKYLTSEDNQKRWAESTNSMPVLKSLKTGNETIDTLIDQIASSSSDYPKKQLSYNPGELAKLLQATFAEYLLKSNSDVNSIAEKMEKDHRKAIEAGKNQ
ncbi:extracellular solute-binding protein [Paenibacillus sp. J5C_2022]|uniref:ABC transporter substrate-binding protein n=1 Tax=Paenibacillus sp. J5C2022 TaxID=2977129 RepID=UPI0021CFD4CE|nr:extracellular solute-binding protein [Paenibacillus sp. J5C2022]MCU6709958.1 extracellular solute-binding protein [Paenibacillus sp. J5C2022]